MSESTSDYPINPNWVNTNDTYGYALGGYNYNHQVPITYYPTPYCVTNNNCPYCGQYHMNQTCPRIKSIEYTENGVTIKKIEFHDQK